MPMNYIRLLAGLRGGFQKVIAGWRLRLTRPTKSPTNLPATRTVGPRKRSVAILQYLVDLKPERCLAPRAAIRVFKWLK